MHINKTSLNGGLHKQQVAIVTQNTPKKTTNFKIQIFSQPTIHFLPFLQQKRIKTRAMILSKTKQ